MSVGKPEVSLSVLMPFDDGTDPAEMADQIRTQSGAGDVEASIGDALTVKIAADGGWAVERRNGVTQR